MNTQLFGMPIYKTHIDPSSFDKKSIVSVIKKNYKIDPKRNKYDTESDLHHLYGDWDNTNFLIPNLNPLVTVYTKKIEDYFKSFVTSSVKYSFKFEIVNYTCIGKDQFMRRHLHINTDFVGVHYIKFPKDSIPTSYWNQNDYAWYIDDPIKLNHISKLYRHDDINQSWLHGGWHININEDDFVITPGLASHSIPKNNSKDLRMTIIVNIKVEIEEGD